jgi:hypothetical protein
MQNRKAVIAPIILLFGQRSNQMSDWSNAGSIMKIITCLNKKNPQRLLRIFK